MPSFFKPSITPRTVGEAVGLLVICALACTALFGQTARIMVSPGPPPGHRIIWILSRSGMLSGYDSENFELRTSSRSPLPRAAFQHPENVSISPDGQALYSELVSGTDLLRLWISGRFNRQLTGGSDDTRLASGGGLIETSATPAVYFSADGQQLFWFENRFSVLKSESQLDTSETGAFLSWTTNLEGGDPKPVVTLDLPPCKCETGACEETCPIVDAWAPGAGVSDFFFLTRWIPGQTSPDYKETDLYQSVRGVWTGRKLSAPVYEFLDATDHGDTYIAAIPDAGCCGWVNESDDVTYLVRGANRTTLFDEFSRYNNQDYDVSFFTSKALLSPDVHQVALAITSTWKPGQQIRLADEGKNNPEKLHQIQKALTDLPKVEVVRLSDPAKARFSLPDAKLIGWLDSQRLLVWQHGQLNVVDVANGQSKATGLRAESAACVHIQ